MAVRGAHSGPYRVDSTWMTPVDSLWFAYHFNALTALDPKNRFVGDFQRKIVSRFKERFRLPMAKTRKKKSPAKKSPAKKSRAKKAPAKKSSPRSGRRAKAGRMIYYFGTIKCDGDGSMRELLGGKGANLAQMTSIGLPVPPGFTLDV